MLATKLGGGPVGVWTGLAAGLACAAVLLCRRFHRLTLLARFAGAPPNVNQ